MQDGKRGKSAHAGVRRAVRAGQRKPVGKRETFIFAGGEARQAVVRTDGHNRPVRRGQAETGFTQRIDADFRPPGAGRERDPAGGRACAGAPGLRMYLPWPNCSRAGFVSHVYEVLFAT